MQSGSIKKIGLNRPTSAELSMRMGSPTAGEIEKFRKKKSHPPVAAAWTWHHRLVSILLYCFLRFRITPLSCHCARFWSQSSS
jgi:hypothetical protein